MKKPWLWIFLPADVTWEISDTHIRTRRTTTGRILMRASRYMPPNAAESWLAAARNLLRKEAV